MEGGTDDILDASCDRIAMAIVVVNEVVAGGYDNVSDMASMEITVEDDSGLTLQYH